VSTNASVAASGPDAMATGLTDERRRFLETRVLSGLAGPMAERRAWRVEKLWPWWRYRVREDRAAAYHEAAHAIVNEIAEGSYTHFVSVVATRVGVHTIGGFTTSSTSPDPSPLAPSPVTSILPTDRENVARACVELGGGWKGGLRELHRLRPQAIQLVEEHWPAIRAVAKALSERRELDRSAFLAVLEVHQNEQAIDIAASGAPS
jgi:hypothetical protein